jgi:hypothetical protein
MAKHKAPVIYSTGTFRYAPFIPPEREKKLIPCKYCGGAMRWYHSAIADSWVAIEPNSYREHDCSLPDDPLLNLTA